MAIEYDKKKLRIPDDNAEIPREGLGQYVDGYRTIITKPSSAILVLLFFFFILSVVLVVVGESWVRGCSFMAVVIDLMCMGFYLSSSGHYKRDRNTVYVFSNGFVWEVRSFDGTLRSRDVVNFDDVEVIELNRRSGSPDHHAQGSGNYFAVDMIVKGRNGRVIFDHLIDKHYLNASDSNDAAVFAYRAVNNSWSQVVLARCQRELVVKGFVNFGNIRMERNAFYVDGVEYLRDAYRYIINDRVIIFHPREAERSPYYKPVLNATGAYAIDISHVPNLTAFILFFNDLYRGRMS